MVVSERLRPRARSGARSLADDPVRAARAREAARLLRLVAAGDETAFAALYDGFGRAAYALALRIVRDSRLAEDVVQDAFVTVWRQAGVFDSERASAAAWVFTLVHRRAVDAARREGRRRAEPLDETVDSPATTSDADAVDRDRVRAALAALDRREREVIALAYYGGLTQSEIAARLETPLGTVKSRTFSGLTRLQQALAVS